jgi:hypothetical protein
MKGTPVRIPGLLQRRKAFRELRPDHEAIVERYYVLFKPVGYVGRDVDGRRCTNSLSIKSSTIAWEGGSRIPETLSASNGTLDHSTRCAIPGSIEP